MQITIDLPDNLTQTETFNESDWLREIAIALFRRERVSLGRASKIAGIHITDFQQLIAERGISVYYDIKDFEQDIQSLQKRGWL